jgi:hypothetical protein
VRYFKIIQYALAFGAVRLIPELYWLVYALPAKIFLFLALSTGLILWILWILIRSQSLKYFLEVEKERRKGRLEQAVLDRIKERELAPPKKKSH